MALQQVAQALLASRGIPPTPENVNRAMAALDANPELAQRIAAGAQRGTGEQGEITEQNPVAAALTDPFDTAFATAVNNGQSSIDDVAAAEQAQVSPPPAQAASQGVPSGATALESASATAPTPPSVQQGASDPAFEQAVAEIAAEEGAQDPGSPGPSGDDDGRPIPILLPGAAGGAAAGGRALIRPEIQATQTGVRPSTSSGPQAALPPPEALQLERQKLLDAPQKSLTGPGDVAQDISETIDEQDTVSKRASPERVKEITRGSRQAVRVTLDKNKYIVYEDGPILNDTTKVIVREQTILEAIREFLRAQGSRFATLARIF